jgi:two-component system, NarL family, invasion response regulator UvrY
MCGSQEHEVEKGKSQVTPDVPPRRVLVADNNSDLAQILGEFIRMDTSMEFLGYVLTGAAAVQRVQDEAVDILVLDLGLEDCHGFDVLDKLHASVPATKVIVHTGHSSPELAAHAKRRGAAAFIVKDGDVDALLTAIRAA